MFPPLTKYAASYQHILSRCSDFQQLGKRIVHIAETAYAFRDVDKVKELGLILFNLPIKEYRLIGQYYLGWCAYREGQTKETIFEKVLEGSATYKSRALMSLAAVQARKNDFDSELKHLTESLRYVNDPSTFVELLWGASVVKAKEGYHQKAINDLESIIR